MPKVSILVPVYNVSEYLRECMDSILSQTLQDIEIICINDGSTDESPEILRHYEKMDSRVKVINKENTGYGNSMNLGIEYATGEYLGIVESDDYAPPHMYETLYKLASKHDLDFVKADFYRFTHDESGKRIFHYNSLAGQRQGYYNRLLNIQEDITPFYFAMNTWSGIYKREYLNAYHIRHNETPGASFQDNGFWFQTFAWSTRAYFLDKPLYCNRRDNPGSSVHDPRKVYCMNDEYEFIYKFLCKNPSLKEKFIGIYWVKKLHNYVFTYGRIGDEFKEEYLLRMQREFQEGLDRGELNEHLYTELEWKKVRTITMEPLSFPIYDKLVDCRARLREATDELAAVKSSTAYRVGRLITWPLRRIKDLLRSLKTNGLRTTFSKLRRKMYTFWRR